MNTKSGADDLISTIFFAVYIASSAIFSKSSIFEASLENVLTPILTVMGTDFPQELSLSILIP